MKFNRKQLIIALAGIVLLGSFGYVGALNGWFGGGSSVPEDTMTRGLVGYWNMDEGGGQTAKDLSGNGNNGTLGAATTAGSDDPNWTKGKNGGALKFDGKDDYIGAGLNNASLNITSAISIEAWINPNIIPSARGVIARKAGVYYFQISAAGNLEAYFYSTTSPGYHTMTTTIPLNTWTHVAVTYNGASVVLFQNGKSESFSNTGGMVSALDEITIGSESGLDRYFSGSIDDVRIYNRALSAAEVKFHYNRGGPVGEWKFDEGSGQKAFDSTENNNNGTLGSSDSSDVNDPTWTSGIEGSALSFDANNDYVDMGNKASLNNAEEITIEAWVNLLSNNTRQRLVIKTNWTDNGFLLNAWEDGKFYAMYHIDGAWRWSFASAPIKTNTWYHVVSTYSSTTKQINLYVNGFASPPNYLSGLGTYSITATPSNNLYIGTFTAETINGSIDDVRIYNYARSADEIRLDYNAGLAAKFGPTGKTCAEDPARCMNEGLAGYWNMDEGGGQLAKDLSNNKNNGTLGASSSSGVDDPKWTKGKKENALKFDGKEDIVEVPNSNSLDITGNSISLEAWINPSELSEKYIISKAQSDNITDGYNLLITSINFYFRLGDGATRYQLFTPHNLTANTWTHVVAVYDGSLMKIYKNGIELPESTAFTGNIGTNSNNINIGNRIGSGAGSSTYKWVGSIDEVRIYNRALSPEEINYHYNEKKPVIQWDLDEGAGTTARDSAGNLDITFPATESERPTWTKP